MQISKLLLESILIESNKVIFQIIVDLFNIAIKIR